MKYIRKEDYDNNNFDNLIEVENSKDLLKIIGEVKGYGIEPCPDERADGILYVRV